MRKSELNQNIYISKGNTKLASNETQAFMIFSLPAVSTCPQSTELCRKFCYARKAELMYKQVLPCRERNYNESLKDSFVKDVSDWIEYLKGTKTYKGKQIFFRWHESGDIYSMDYLSKMYKIARLHPEVNFMAYTKSIAILSAFDKFLVAKPSNITFRFSIWADTDAQSLLIAKQMHLPTYTAGDTQKVERACNTGHMLCHCDCTTCKMCYNSNAKQIIVPIH